MNRSPNLSIFLKMTEYLEIHPQNTLFQKICAEWNININMFSNILRISGGLLMGSTALACIINEAINDDIDVFIDTEKGFYILHHYLLENNYHFIRKSKLSAYSGMVTRITGPFELTVFTYKTCITNSSWGGSPAKSFQIILCNNVGLARDSADIGATQCAFDGLRWTIPVDHLPYILKKTTWIRPDYSMLSKYEREIRIEKYKNRGFTFIAKPEDELMKALSAMEIS